MNANEQEIAAAKAYEELHVPALFRQWAPIVLDSATLSEGDRVLDVACGTGVLAREAKARFGDSCPVTGLDAGAGMLTVAQALDPSVDWRQGLAESLPFEDAAFDVVVSQFGLMFFSGPARGASRNASGIGARRTAGRSRVGLARQLGSLSSRSRPA